MKRSKSFIPPPNQQSIKMFISGGSVGWKIGDSPVTGGPNEDDCDEKAIHTRILDAGIFHHFSNQPAALAYLNGQFVTRKDHAKKKNMMKKTLTKFQTNGVTQRFMKVPTKLCPKDKYNSERELERVTKELNVMKNFKTELVCLKKNCLDDNQSVKPKKLEEYDYYSKEIDEIKVVIKDMEMIREKLHETNLQINKSSGFFGCSSSVFENKRIMRRRKEGSKNEARKSFQRCVGSLEKFLLKYTSRKFENTFDIVERKVEVSANRHGAPRQVRVPQGVACSMNVDDEFEQDVSELLDEKANSDGEYNSSLANNNSLCPFEVENNNRPSGRSKYQHTRIERSIVLKNERLKVSDFKHLEFIKTDLKSLKLLKDLGATDIGITQVIQFKISEWELDKGSELCEVADRILSEDEEEDFESEYCKQKAALPEDEEDATDKAIGNQIDKKSMKKKYKKSIVDVLEKKGRIKKKKLLKILVKISAEFDKSDEGSRLEKIEKYLPKVKKVCFIEKYVELEMEVSGVKVSK